MLRMNIYEQILGKYIEFNCSGIWEMFMWFWIICRLMIIIIWMVSGVMIFYLFFNLYFMWGLGRYEKMCDFCFVFTVSSFILSRVLLCFPLRTIFIWILVLFILLSMKIILKKSIKYFFLLISYFLLLFQGIAYRLNNSQVLIPPDYVCKYFEF